MIQIDPQLVGVEMVQRRLGLLGPALRERVLIAMHRLAIMLQNKVKRDKLSGQVLKVRTGRLRNSIAQHVEEGTDAITATVGTNVIYGGFWERGYHGLESVRAHERTITQVFGRAIPPLAVMVEAHSRRVDQAPRPFLRPALDELRPTIRDELTRAAGVL